MQSRDFAFWLQGFFELTAGQTSISPEQAEMIKIHLALVFKHDPTMAHPAPAVQERAQLPPRPLQPPDWLDDVRHKIQDFAYC